MYMIISAVTLQLSKVIIAFDSVIWSLSSLRFKRLRTIKENVVNLCERIDSLKTQISNMILNIAIHHTTFLNHVKSNY